MTWCLCDCVCACLAAGKDKESYVVYLHACGWMWWCLWWCVCDPSVCVTVDVNDSCSLCRLLYFLDCV